jgi:hypothetical protein
MKNPNTQKAQEESIRMLGEKCVQGAENQVVINVEGLNKIMLHK